MQLRNVVVEDVMKQVKAKYYAPTEDRLEPLIIPLEKKVSFVSLDEPVEKVELSGSDEHGDYIIVDFVQDKGHFFDYTVSAQKDAQGNIVSNSVRNKAITQEEWEKAE
jgi:hypothetical protein